MDPLLEASLYACFPIGTTDGRVTLRLLELQKPEGGGLVGVFRLEHHDDAGQALGPARERSVVLVSPGPPDEDAVEREFLGHWGSAVLLFSFLGNPPLGDLAPAAVLGAASGSGETVVSSIRAQVASCRKQVGERWPLVVPEWGGAGITGAHGALELGEPREEGGALVVSVTHLGNGVRRSAEVVLVDSSADRDPERAQAFRAAVLAGLGLILELVPVESSGQVELQSLFPHELLGNPDNVTAQDFLLAWLDSGASSILEESMFPEVEARPLAVRARLPILGVFSVMAVSGLGPADALTHLVGSVLVSRVAVGSPLLIFYYAARTPGLPAAQLAWSGLLATGLVGSVAAGLLVTRGPHGFSVAFDALCLLMFAAVGVWTGVRMWAAEP